MISSFGIVIVFIVTAIVIIIISNYGNIFVVVATVIIIINKVVVVIKCSTVDEATDYGMSQRCTNSCLSLRCNRVLQTSNVESDFASKQLDISIGEHKSQIFHE